MNFAGVLIVGVLVALAAFFFARHGNPVRRARILRRTGFTLMVLNVAFFGTFLTGDTFSDPGGWRAIGLIAIWLIPMVALGLLAWLYPDRTGWLLAAVVAVVIGLSIWFAIDPAAWRAVENRNGPIRAVIVFVVSAILALWGLRRTMRAGVLLVIVGFLPILLSSFGRGGIASVAVAGTVPFLTGVLYVAAGYLDRRQPPPAEVVSPQNPAKAA